MKKQPITFLPYLTASQNPWGGWLPITILNDPEPDFSPAPNNDLPLVQDKVMRGQEEGYLCSTCKRFSPHADLNYPENDPCLFKCYPCRKGLNNLF